MTEKQTTTNHPKPVVRFAPSPTGFLHIGGARTALFNWLYAKAKGGTFLLRIEDTDRARNNDEAVAAIIDGLKWLELDWTGEPVSQFSRVARHKQEAERLLAEGHAYRCFLTQAELEEMRAKAEAEKQPLTIRSPWRDKPASEAPSGAPFTIRLKAPRQGKTAIEDHVQGNVIFPNKDLDDLILLRSDGTPTYNLAVVVDDHDMGVTHVIRGVDHLTNTARQTQIYQGLGWSVPEFSHVPLIHGPDGAKLSKRHGALGVEAYRAMGYLPEALRNYLVRLGWSHGDDEIIPTAQLIEWFDVTGIGKSAARFDFAKLEALNAHYIRQSDDHELFERAIAILPEIEGGDEIAQALAGGASTQFRAAIPSLKERSKTLLDLIHGAGYIFARRPLVLDDKASKQIDADSRRMLAELLPRLHTVKSWDAQSIESEVRAFAEAAGLKLGKVAQPLRAALTGSTVSPPVFDVMTVLGDEESLARIADHAGHS
ncbi:MAG: glutamate--tRNA ligase [Hyphomicrobiaceae bacterium]|nr:glutamate--tRNA ligase [Hyphomicrobiaceae bacterium]